MEVHARGVLAIISGATGGSARRRSTPHPLYFGATMGEYAQVEYSPQVLEGSPMQNTSH